MQIYAVIFATLVIPHIFALICAVFLTNLVIPHIFAQIPTHIYKLREPSCFKTKDDFFKFATIFFSSLAA